MIWAPAKELLRSMPESVLGQRVYEGVDTLTVDEFDCWVSPYSPTSCGQRVPVIKITYDGRQTDVKHSLAMFYWVNNFWPKHPYRTVSHLCGNKLCVRPLHLKCESQAENNRRRDDNDYPYRRV